MKENIGTMYGSDEMAIQYVYMLGEYAKSAEWGHDSL
jgi:hypothetical protein